MPDEISYIRQTDIFNPINQKYKIVILGAGAIGSFVALNLAKLGFSDIVVYDFDIVELHNLANQFYRIEDVNKFKVDALKEIIKSFAGVEIDTRNEKVTLKTKLPLSANCLYLLTFDTLEQRKIVFNLLQQTIAGVLLDIRVGGEQYDIQIVDLFEDDEIEKWKKSFDIIPNDLPCGARSIIYTNLNVASEVCNLIKKLNNDEAYPKKLLRHMKSYKILNDLTHVK